MLCSLSEEKLGVQALESSLCLHILIHGVMFPLPQGRPCTAHCWLLPRGRLRSDIWAAALTQDASTEILKIHLFSLLTADRCFCSERPCAKHSPSWLKWKETVQDAVLCLRSLIFLLLNKKLVSCIQPHTLLSPTFCCSPDLCKHPPKVNTKMCSLATGGWRRRESNTSRWETTT